MGRIYAGTLGFTAFALVVTRGLLLGGGCGVMLAAAAALLVSRAARRSVPLDGTTIRRILVETATPWAQAVDSGHSAGHGAGILNVHAALRGLDHYINQATTRRYTARAA